jgi:3-oxoacyl-[acyl-carrier protein] reductase
VTEPRHTRTVLVTGAARGLGKEIALRFGRNHDRVVIHFHRSEEEAAAVADNVRSAGGTPMLLRADVTVSSEVDSLVAKVTDRWGAIDVLVNNAGAAKDGLALRMSEDDWDRVIATNLKGPFTLIREAAKSMIEQRSGHIISIASISGVQGREGQANYSSSKSGLIGLTKAAARELGPFNIRVNAVLPGYLATDMGGTVNDGVRDRIMRENVLGRSTTGEEVAEFIFQLSLMQDTSGQVFNLDSRIL